MNPDKSYGMKPHGFLYALRFCRSWIFEACELVQWSDHAASPHLLMLTDRSQDVIFNLCHASTHVDLDILISVRCLGPKLQHISKQYSRHCAIKMPPTRCAPCLRQMFWEPPGGGKAEAVWAAKVHDGSLVGPIIKIQPWNLRKSWSSTSRLSNLKW